MYDILLNDDHDLALVNGRSAPVSGDAAVAQQVLIRLRLIAGELFAAHSKGVVRSEILGKGADDETIAQILRDQCLDVPGVRDVDPFTIERLSGRAIAATIVVRLASGETTEVTI